MKTLDNKTITFKDKPVVDEHEVPYTTEMCIKLVLENSAYLSSSDIIKASGILARLKADDGKIELSDTDYEFVKQWSATYLPLVSKGLVFLDYFNQLQ